jgi:hypothetical protein
MTEGDSPYRRLPLESQIPESHKVGKFGTKESLKQFRGCVFPAYELRISKIQCSYENEFVQLLVQERDCLRFLRLVLFSHELFQTLVGTQFTALLSDLGNLVSPNTKPRKVAGQLLVNPLVDRVSLWRSLLLVLVESSIETSEILYEITTLHSRHLLANIREEPEKGKFRGML